MIEANLTLIYTDDSFYLEHSPSRTSFYLQLKSRTLCVGCNLFFSLYLELSLSRTNFLVPCEFEIERVNCISQKIFLTDINNQSRTTLKEQTRKGNSSRRN